MDARVRRGTIVTLTMNPAIDASTSVERVTPDDKLRCDALRREPGGGGINVARAIGRLGGDALALYAAGGAMGALLETMLEAEPVRHERLDVAGSTRENVTVAESSTGRQYRFVMPGAELTGAECSAILDRIDALDPAPDYVVASGSLPPGVGPEFHAQLARQARDHGTRFVLDTSGAALREGLASGAWLIKPNLRELGQIAGRDVSDDTEQERVARDLVDSGVLEVVVVSLGAAGALLVTAGRCERIRAPTVPIRSKVGAGDSTVAGIVLGMVRGMSVSEAVRYGVAAGAAAVMTPGTELCRRGDTERLFARLQEDPVASNA
jgi:6-phosphofructokinase 2